MWKVKRHIFSYMHHFLSSVALLCNHVQCHFARLETFQEEKMTGDLTFWRIFLVEHTCILRVACTHMHTNKHTQLYKHKEKRWNEKNLWAGKRKRLIGFKGTSQERSHGTSRNATSTHSRSLWSVIRLLDPTFPI